MASSSQRLHVNSGRPTACVVHAAVRCKEVQAQQPALHVCHFASRSLTRELAEESRKRRQGKKKSKTQTLQLNIQWCASDSRPHP